MYRLITTHSFRFIISIVCCLISVLSHSQQPKLILPIGHTSAINSACFSPDGKRILTTSDDYTAKIWDAISGSLLANLEGHRGHVKGGTFSPDSKRIVTVSEDSSAQIWDAIDGSLFGELMGHTGRVYDASFSPDGNKIVTASDDNTSKVWDAFSLSLIVDLKGHTDPLTSASFSPDGKRIVTSSSDGSVKIWDALKGSLIANLKGHSGPVYKASFSPDGDRVVTSSEDSTAKIWDAISGSLIADLRGHTGSVYACFSPDGKRIVTASWDHTIKIWDAFRGSFITDLKGYTDKIASTSFSPDSKMILTPSFDNTVALCDANNGSLLAVLKGHTGPVTTASFSPDGKRIVTGSEDCTAKIWNVISGSLIADLKGHTNLSLSASFSPNGKIIVTSSNVTPPTNGETAKIWDAVNGTLLNDLKLNVYDINSTCFSPDSKKILTASNHRTTNIWDAVSGLLVTDLGRDSCFTFGASFSPDGKRVLTISSDSTAKVWNATSGSHILDLRGHIDQVNGASYSYDGKKIVTASDDNTAKIWDAVRGSLIADLIGHKGPIYQALFSPDDKNIVTVSKDSTIKIWDAFMGPLLAEIKVNTDAFVRTSFSPDSKRIVTLSEDSSAKIWDTKAGTLIGELRGHTGWVYNASFSPDGKKIVTASDDNTAKIWDAVRGSLIADLIGHTGAVYSASFSPDGKRIVTSSNDNTIKIWNAEKGSLLYTYFGVDSSDYLIVDKDNHYDGTSGARNLLYYTCGTEIIELQQLKDKLWVPGLAERINRGEQITAPKLSDLDVCGLIPIVELNETKTSYQFKITPRRGGLGETVLYINNNETKRYQINQLKKTSEGYELTVLKDSIQSYLIAGIENLVTVRSYVANNDIISRGAGVKVDQTKQQVIVPKLYAVIIGVSDYKAADMHLNYAAKDAVDIGNVISVTAKKYLNKDGKEHVYVYNFNTTKERYNYPDKKNIEQVFDTIAKKATANDILLVFFAGHGTVEVDKDNKKQFYFLTSDASSFNNASQGGISTKELIEWIHPRNIKAQKRILILDACNSGQAINDIEGSRDLMAVRNTDVGAGKREIERLNDQSGMYILSASASNQSAYEFSRYSQGLLTYTLLKAIKQQPDILEDMKYLNLSRWFSAAKKSVNDIMNQVGNKGRQEPQLVANTNFNIGIVDEDVVSGIKLSDEKRMFTRSEFHKAQSHSDSLKLRQLVDKELYGISSRGEKNDIIYNSDYEGSDAYSLSGDYRIEGSKITVSCSLLKGGIEIVPFDVTGNTEDLKSLVEEIVKRAVEIVGKS